MTRSKHMLRSVLFACTAITIGTGDAIADSATTVNQAVNFFQNAKATGGAPVTVDAKGPVTISDDIELPGFAFSVYDVDFTSDSLTMKLVAQLEKLQITLYDNTTSDRYYYAFDTNIGAAEIADNTDENFKATVELIEPGTSVTSAGAFIDGMATEFTFENGGLLITIGEGTDLTKILANGGSLTVKF
ncbi:MAG: hypothetical protein AAF404_01600 [Pseudomonadota bacterium]